MVIESFDGLVNEFAVGGRIPAEPEAGVATGYSRCPSWSAEVILEDEIDDDYIRERGKIIKNYHFQNF